MKRPVTHCSLPRTADRQDVFDPSVRQIVQKFRRDQFHRDARSGGAVQGGEKQRRYAAALVRPDLRTAYQGGNARLFRRGAGVSRDRYGDQVPRGRRVVPLYPQRLAVGGGVEDLRSEPVGYMGVKDYVPARFRGVHFMRRHQAMRDWGVARSWKRREAVDEFVHGKIMELFRLYLVVGGMPPP